MEKERQSLHKEKERVKRAIDDERDKHDRIVKQMAEQLDIEKETHSQTKDILNKLKQVKKQLFSMFCIYDEKYSNSKILLAYLSKLLCFSFIL